MTSFTCHVDVDFEDLIVRDHRVHGVRVLPGVVFFDLLLRALRARGVDPRRVELREVLFSEPVAVAAGRGRRVSLELEAAGPGEWSVRGLSRAAGEDGEQARLNFRCTALLVDPGDVQAPARTSEPGPASGPAAERLELEAAYAYARAVGIDHLEFMKGQGTIALDERSLRARIEPSPLARAYGEDFWLHPACLDSATLVPFLAVMRGHEDGLRPFIPIHLRRFRAWAAITGAVEVVVDRRRCALDEELFRCDIELRALEGGALLARFEGLTSKRIRSPELLERLVSGAGGEASAGVEASAPSRAPELDPVVLAEGLIRELVLAELGPAGPERPEALDGETNFYELGLDSADLLSVSAGLGERLGLHLYPTLLFERSSIGALAAHLGEHHGEALRELAPSPASPSPSPSPTRIELADADADADADEEPIAIVGLAGRYADVDEVEALWREILAPGRDCIEEIPTSRWDHRRWFEPGDPKWGSFLPAVDRFDPLAFGVAPREAELMDPQERLFLEVASEALSDAGCGGRVLAGRRVGVFAGVMWGQYEALGIERSATSEQVLTPMSFAASVANRVSHHFDLRGPSLALDSMCSSSLTALHLACESLRRGECEAALAGGVNLILHPSKYLFLARNKMLASDGRCRSFGEGGDGYVPGEGVGVVVLARLSVAEREGYPIHGLIRASALNHGGHANGYTVPDVDAQAEVIAAALRRAGIAAGSLSYVEAHGTGTRLGDPIEIRGLEKALRSDDPSWRCAIGSIKSNLGHLEAAAGIAGLTKVLLQLRHRELAPSLHARTLNPHIDFERAPFVVQRELGDWRPVGGGPLRAGISSFGAGGSNAHVVVEEYLEPRPASTGTDAGPQLVALSARTRTQLEGGAARLRAALERLAGTPREPALARVAFTLLTRGDPDGVRAATVVESLAELREALADLDGDRWQHGAPGRRRSSGAPLQADARRRETLEALARAFVDGASIDPDSLWPGGLRPRRCSLPAWPFIHRRCWLPEAHLHPLVHRRLGAEAGEGARFETDLRASDPLLADHRVDAEPVVPGVALAAMIAAAAELDEPALAEGLRLTKLRWSIPARADEGGSLALRVELDAPGSAGSRRARIRVAGRTCAEAWVAPRAANRIGLPLATVRERCELTRTGEDCYRALAARGLDYGPSLRVLERVALAGIEGRGLPDEDEALAELDCAGAATTLGPIPALDGALQAIVALLDHAGDPGRWLPAGIDGLELRGPAPARVLVHLRVLERGPARWRFDCVLADRAGRSWARLEGVELRERGGAPRREGEHEGRGEGRDEGRGEGRGEGASDPVRAFGERWIAEPLPADLAPLSSLPGGPLLVFEHEAGALADGLGERLEQPIIRVVPGAGFGLLAADRYAVAPGDAEALAALLDDLDRRGVRPATIVHAWARPEAESTLARELELGLHTLVGLTRAWLGRRPTPLRLLVVHPLAEPIHAALEGLCRTARREHPGLLLSTLACAREDLDGSALGDRILAELALVHDPAPVRWIGGRRERLRRFALPELEAALAELRTSSAGGLASLTAGVARPVCLITGGLGGLGRLVASALGRMGEGATLILAGRRPAAAVEAELAALRRELPDPGRLHYAAVDVAEAAEVEALVAGIVAEHGRLDLVVHAAGIVRDGLLNRLDRAEVEAVLGPKLLGARHLDRATRHLPLRAFVLFSSAAGMIGNPGQAAYAYANRYLDRLAEARAEAVAAGRAHGRSLAIAWPLWREGGMRVDAGIEAMLERSLGMRPLASAEGLRCLAAAGRSDDALVGAVLGFMAGELARIDAALELRGVDPRPGPIEGTSSTEPTPAPAPEAEALDRVRRILGELLGLAYDEVDPEVPLGELGVDSITLVELVDRVNAAFSVELAPVAMFELDRVAGIVDMIAEAGGELLDARDGLEIPERRPAPAIPEPEPEPEPRDRDVAILGMAGRFPGAPDLDALWAQLVEVRDLIREVPAERWDWRAIDGDALAGPNRTRARWGGFIDGVDRFDAEFFRVDPKQAAWMDPQHRLMLEATWAAIADAGYRPEELRGREVGVFIGIGSSDYHDRARALGLAAEAQSALGRAHSLLPNRISYLLDLHGPSLPIETACSSSLVAVHQAVEALRSGRCELAIVGGVNLILDPYLSVCFDRAGMLSPRGRCRSFDAGADGYVRGEGLGVLVLSSLPRALAEGDRIRAVIKGSAINHGGLAHALTAPNPRSQARLLCAAYRDAELDPLGVGYVEAHGTGTALGDPIEVRGLCAAFAELHRERGRERPPVGHCALGSIKANIGHLETAAGIAGLIKAALCLERRTIPGLAHFEALNPQIELDDAPVRVAAQTEAWPAPGGGEPRRAGVSSFGFGGSNAHVVLEEAPRGHRARRPGLPPPKFSRARHWLFDEPAPLERPIVERRPAAAVASLGEDRRERILAELCELLVRVARVPRERVDPEVDFERYGLESVLILELNHALRARFGPLPATLFYKYKTLAALADYLAEHPVDHPVDEAPEPEPERAEPEPEPEPEIRAEDIAIIGVSGRYPGAPELDALWEQLIAGRHAITEIPAARFDYRPYFAEQPEPGRIDCKWGGFLDEVDRFDAELFEVAPWLARYMDPQERLFLEQAWACVEDAGYTPRGLAGARASTGDRRAPVGVFVGVSYNEYAALAAEVSARAHARGSARTPFNTQSFSVANRVSYALGLGGPSMTVDTACSSSLNAVHMACESIRAGACELAIAGGVNLSLHPNKYLMLSANRFAAADGRCRAFAEGGQGYVPGEGVGAVLLKPLAAALRDGDSIHALIKGGAVNHDGKTFGYTVPNPVAQTEVIGAAWERAGVDPRTISYIEAHGTGTQLGDPIEITGLGDAFARYTADRQFCAIGSIKSNIGHLEAAAGIASLHKVVLQMRRRTLAPTLIHGPRLNPAIDFEASPVRVQTEAAPWVASPGQPLRAGVSSFGAGGVNVHLVLEAWTPAARPVEVAPREPVLIPLSAREGERLRVVAERLLRFVEAELDDDPRALRDLAYTLQVGRVAMRSRLLILARDRGECLAALRAYLDGGVEARELGLFVGEGSSGHGGEPERLRERLDAGRHAELAAAWVTGEDLPWASLYPPGGPRRRLHLPSYPFAGDRYWIELDALAAAPADARPEARDSGGDCERSRERSEVDEALAALREAPAAGRLAACERLVSAVVAELLEFGPTRRPDPRQGLFAMGMESVQSAALVVRLERLLELTLYATIVFDYPTIRELAQQLVERLPELRASADGEAMIEAGTETEAATETAQLVLAEPRWRPVALAAGGAAPRDRLALAAPPAAVEVLAADASLRAHADLDALLRAGVPAGDEPLLIVDFTLLEELERAAADAPERAFERLFTLARALLPGRRPVELVLVHALDEAGEPSATAAALAGFARSLSIESPRLRCRLVGVDQRLRAQPSELAALALAEAGEREHEHEHEVRHRGGERAVRVLVERPGALTPSADRAPVVEPGAVVLISGGLGKLGLLVAERLGRAGARLALLARSAPTDEQQRTLDRLREAGVELSCVRADVSRRAELEAAVAAVRERYGKLDGIIHAAGCLRDSLLPGKTLAEAEAVLRPKVAGCRELDAATAGLELRFFVLFSSTAGLTGNVGQCDYAFANAYLDGFARERRAAVVAGHRRGRTLVFDWPLWAEGGMQVDADTLEFMARRAGFRPMPSELGLDTLDAALATEAGGGQLAVFHGDGPRIRAQFLTELPAELPAEEPALTPVDEPARVELGEPRDAVAIVGLACRFPGGCDSPEALWELLLAGRETVTTIPEQRWDLARYHDPDREAEGTHYTRAGSFLAEDPGLFDAGLFGVSPREAAEIDPQQRLLLEVCWRALESAGIPADALAGADAGVYVGITGSDYGQLPRRAEQLGAYTATGVATNLAAGRLAHQLGVHGPALSIDTACSSSLMAVHLARQALIHGETELALVGGVNLLLSPSTFVALSRMGALAPDGRCKSFSAEADGYGRGEGCGVVILERLADARRRGHRVRAVLLGSAANHDGSSGGLTVPNGRAQRALLERALSSAALEPAEVGYLEAHGTGTPLGDPIELRAIGEVYGRRPAADPLLVGALKANLGHLEAAAGIAGLIKAALCVEQGEIPGQPGLGAINPRVDLSAARVELPRTRRRWAGPRRIAGVSSFGFSGTNVHVLVGRAPADGSGFGEAPARARCSIPVLCLSAAGPEALVELAASWRRRLAGVSLRELGDLCAAALARSPRLRHRAAFVGRSVAELDAALAAFIAGEGQPEGGEHPDPLRREAAELDGLASLALGEPQRFASALAALFVRGLDSPTPDLIALLGDPRAPVALPAYPFQRRRYWIAAPEPSSVFEPFDCFESVAPGQTGAGAGPRTLRYRLSHARLPDLADNHGVFHIGHYLELVCRAAARPELLGLAGCRIEAVEFRHALRIGPNERRELELRFDSEAAGEAGAGAVRWSLVGRGDGPVHARGILRAATAPARVARVSTPAAGSRSRAQFYARLRELSFELGPSVRWVERVRATEGLAIAELGPDPELDADAGLRPSGGLGFHPGILDACAQLVAVAAPGLSAGTRFMVVGIDGVELGDPRRRPGTRAARCRLRMLPEREGLLRAELELLDEDDRVILAVDGLSLRRLAPAEIARIEVAARPEPDPRGLEPGAPRRGAEARTFVRERVAAQLDMDPAELDPAVPLRELGMDSIVGLALARELGEGLGVELSPARLLAGPSVDELLDQLGLTSGPRATPTDRPPASPERWFEFVVRRPDPRVRLVCLPFGAGGASAYRRWSGLDPAIEVWPVQLPGRETRIGERPLADLDAVLDALEPLILAHAELPLALYGQSMGGLLALELARRLQACARPPIHLFVGGLSAPSVQPNPYLADLRARLRREGLAELPPPDAERVPDGFWEVFRELPEAKAKAEAKPGFEHLRPVLPMVLADLALVSGYRHRPAPILDLPITVVHGERDDRVPLDSLAGWSALSSQVVDQVEVPGDHFFISDPRAFPSLAAALAAALLPPFNLSRRPA